MFRSFFIILGMLFSMSSFSSEYFEYDKQLHFVASAGIGAASEIYFDDNSKSLALCGAAGIGKEVYDEITYGGFSAEDLVADAVGCLVGVYGIEISGWKLNVAREEKSTFLGVAKNF
ncbi:hypothetical protein [Psychromonas sp. SP041]|uniref:hypothetical protein n=1 Tax=Psychromonas sp. SP041 TaxID=1365007 RepID=UPI0010C7CE91|nr:hypothetical protein [Psychromonas sp. SP041]